MIAEEPVEEFPPPPGSLEPIEPGHVRWMVELKNRHQWGAINLEWLIYSLYDDETDARTSARVQTEAGNTVRLTRTELVEYI